MTAPRDADRKPELVCPAGSLRALTIAVDAGADAVYMGLKDSTNARNFAGLNFDLAQMRSGIDYAHARGRKVLMALNPDAELGRGVDRAPPARRVARVGVGVQRHQHLAAARVCVVDAAAHLREVEVQAGEIARVRRVFQAHVDRVGARVDGERECAQRPGRADELGFSCRIAGDGHRRRSPGRNRVFGCRISARERRCARVRTNRCSAATRRASWRSRRALR